MVDSRTKLEQKICKMRWEPLAEPNVIKLKKKNKTLFMVVSQRDTTERAPNGEIWNNLSNMI